MKKALVLGGGGVAGIAWITGLRAGLAREGVDIARADVIIGTSGGSVVGAQIAAGVPLDQLLSAQLAPPADSKETARPYSQADSDARNRQLIDKVGGDVVAARKRIAAYALRSETVPLPMRRDIIASRLPTADWPEGNLRVVAVDTATAEHRLFDRASGVDFVDAIAASCAVPGAWPCVPIGGALWMDGGIRSHTNADLAAGARSVLVVAPLGWSDGDPVCGHLRAEVYALESQGTEVHVVVPDAGSLEAMTDNVLDPARRLPSARAGLAQGQRIAAQLAARWAA
ncbi:patatin-like phospholipase family protein [Ramlibacter humi]|uniref:Patatin-like phospholipase family protein n=1 Tax=Ramlibacter humi TaxID=2530451 RepID=A0A4Z0C8W4_9BURK|nr:patatin-like phospholipase family protein [Ramlibacter humi]TFZ07741.1 patatin-like phospholipase family protein [Ramlibacter humi]